MLRFNAALGDLEQYPGPFRDGLFLLQTSESEERVDGQRLRLAREYAEELEQLGMNPSSSCSLHSAVCLRG
jgi:hypothetical protein